MKRDENGLMISEECSWPGNVGDSCANTARSELLNPQGQPMCHFVTGKGFVRYTNLPADWMEDDFSDDQCLPLYMAAPTPIKIAIRTRLPYKAGNGNIHAPLTYCIIWGHHRLANLLLLAQLFFMTKVKWRWDDGKRSFQPTEGSACDWLNWFATCVYLKRLGALSFTPPIDLVSQKVYTYFQSEPNNKQVLEDFERGFELWS
jgi:hypothetical protein